MLESMRKPMRLISCLFALSFVLPVALARSAEAQPAKKVGGENTTEKVKRLYQEGTQHYNLSEFEEAVAAYREAYRLRPDAVFLFNIAQSYRMLKRYGQASQFYKSYLRVRPDASNRGEVERRIEEMDAAAKAENGGTAPPPPPDIGIVTPPPPNGPVTPPSDNGQHVPPPIGDQGTPTGVVPDQASPGADAAQSDVVATASTDDAARRKRMMPWLVAGAGGLLIVGGVVTGIMTSGIQSDLEKKCPTKMNCPSDVTDLQNSGKTMAAVTDVLLITGAVAAVSGVVWWAVKYRGKPTQVEQPVEQPPVALGCGKQGCVVQARFAF